MESSRRSLSRASIHLHPTAPLAERVLLPGDPARALLLAQTLLKDPIMFNHHRGLWGYTGMAADGERLTIQSTGMGGPSAAIVVSELADLGARRLIRVGTCGSLSSELSLGDLLVVAVALPFDGTSRALSHHDAGERADGGLMPDGDLFEALDGQAATAHVGPVASTDLFYDTPPREQEEWLAAGALAVEMETATLFAVARRRSLQAAAVLLVSDLVLGERVRLSEEALRDGERRLGEAALSALLD